MGAVTRASGLAWAARRVGTLGLMAAACLMMASPLLWAHSHLTATYPEAGAMLEQASERLELQFDSPIRLTQYEVTGPQGVVKLSEDPLGSLAERHGAVPAETLVPGEYEVVWRGIAEDGHTMSGGHRFTIQE
ncbi:copper resistance protein CopC [Halomonas sp. LR3S48]|uniref:copper resistance CopC family protein n=1 Tax=Halomonas sp. LR3S48 TaxID=2982694 RepID=UPI0021E3BF5D|nr:copper resistance CopC family protein [Halomonas sp. LR3S48]UYG03058.1 copper resistance protein CopC [Halomonas sp. LR3S48]